MYIALAGACLYAAPVGCDPQQGLKKDVVVTGYLQKVPPGYEIF